MRAPVLLTAVFVCASSCDKDSSGPALGPGLNILAGNEQVVAAGSVMQPVLVQLRDTNNRPVVGAAVVFEGNQAIVAHDLSTNVDSTSVTRITDANGIARFLLKSECPAGNFESTFRAPAHAATATITTWVIPGAASQAFTQPADTAVYVGASYNIVARLADVCGNVHQQNVTLRPVSSFVATVENGVVTAQAIGRTELTGQLFGQTFSSFVSVVPAGRMVAVSVVEGSGYVRPVSTQLNGAARREFAMDNITPAKYAAVAPIPNSEQVVVAYGVPSRLYIASADGSAQRLIPTPPASIVSEDGPIVSASGWVYFFAAENEPAQTRSVWRVKLDGTQLERLISDVAGHVLAKPWLDVSPDQSTLLFIAQRASDGVDQIGTLNLETREVVMRGLAGSIARFSPNGSRIAFMADRAVWTAALEGQTTTRISQAGTYGALRAGWAPGLSWSADGRFILAERDRGGADVIDLATGMILPLPFARSLLTPLWQK